MTSRTSNQHLHLTTAWVDAARASPLTILDLHPPVPAWNSGQFNATKIPKPKMPMPGSSEMPLGEGSHMVPLDGEFRSVDSRCNQQMVIFSGSRCFLVALKRLGTECTQGGTSFKSPRNRRVAYGCLVWDSKNLDFRRAVIAPTRLILFLLLQT
jgi:hypothetical protein